MLDHIVAKKNNFGVTKDLDEKRNNPKLRRPE
jgi:hypothetical protein